MKFSKLMLAAPLALAAQLAALPAVADAGHGHGAPDAGPALPGGPGAGTVPGMGGMMDPAMMMRMHAMMSEMMGAGMMGGPVQGGMMQGGMVPGYAGGMMGGPVQGGMMQGGMVPGYAGGMMGGPVQGGMMQGGMVPGYAGGMMGGIYGVPSQGGIMGGVMGGGSMRMLDADEDGTLTPDELDTGLRQALATYDADGNGTLSIGEFEAWHSALIRSQMADRFQALDEDGDGEISEVEIGTPARMMRRAMSFSAAQPGAPVQTVPGQDQSTGQDMGMGMGMGQDAPASGN